MKLELSNQDLDKRLSQSRLVYKFLKSEKGEISIYNEGDGIDVAAHPKEKKNGKPIYIPQLIFGELLTSTNYDKDEEKVIGGKNGYGAKITNIFLPKIETLAETSSCLSFF